MVFFLLTCFALNIAMFGAQVFAATENQSINVTFHFENTGNCRLSRIALQNDKNVYDVVEHSDMFLERLNTRSLDACAYENFLQQTGDPVFLIITTGNETVLSGTIKIDDNMYNSQNYKLQLDENNLLVAVQQSTFHIANSNQSTSFDKINHRSRRSVLENQWPKYAQNGEDAQRFYLELYLAVDNEFCKERCVNTASDWCQQEDASNQEDCLPTRQRWCRRKCDVTAVKWNECQTPCRTAVLDIMKRVHSYFREVNIFVVLVGLDFVASTDIYQRTLYSAGNIFPFFKQYVANHKADVEYDVAHLLSGLTVRRRTEFGAANVNTVCQQPEAVGVTVLHATTELYKRSIAVANIIARNLNIDLNADGCRCGRCIMSVTDFSSNIVAPSWSYCSKIDFSYVLATPAVYCLRNKPSFQASLHENVCGNGIVDAGEDCDDGGVTSSTCCNMATCQFQTGALCASGACCDTTNCRIKSSGSVCSTAKNECDVDETCGNNSEWCPEDQYEADGTQCNTNEGKCYEGQCASRDLACKMLYGDPATFGSETCYAGNVEPSVSSGFCNVTWLDRDQTIPCDHSDRMCGLLQCTGGYNSFVNWPNINMASLYKIRTIDTAQCRRKYLHTRDDIRSPYMVPNGSPCETNGICIDSVCKTPTTTQESNSDTASSKSSTTTTTIVAPINMLANGGNGNPSALPREIPENSGSNNFQYVALETIESSDSSSIEAKTSATAPSSTSPPSALPEILPNLATNRSKIQIKSSIIVIGLLALYLQYV